MTGTLLHQVARVEVLKRAWGDVLENDLEDGSMQARVLDLAVDMLKESGYETRLNYAEHTLWIYWGYVKT